MANEPLTSLTPELQNFFNGEKLVLLSTYDEETRTPSISAISWVKSIDEKHIRFSVSANSRIISNVQANPRVTLCIIGLESVYSVVGTCRILENPMVGIAMKLAKLEVEVENVFDSMFWGSKITQEPLYEKTYDPEKAKKLDDDVFSLLVK